MAVRTLIAVVVLCLGLTGLVSEGVLAQTGLVAAYNFDEGSGSTVVDASGNDNTGTVSGATWTTAGRNGGALVFNGTSARVTVANSASLGLTSAMTLEAWVYPTSPPTSWRAILAKNNDGYYLMASSSQGNRPVVGGTWVAGNQNTVGVARLPSNTWTHLAGTFDGATVRLYVNGALVASRAQTTALVPTTGTLQIGGDAHGEFFAGRIDDVRIYNRALSLAEIQTDMTTPVGGAPGPDTIPPTVATTSPTAGATYAANASPLTVAGTAADNVGVTQVTWTNDRGGSGTAAGTSSWTATGIALQPGTNVLVFTARDASANTGTKTLTVSFDATAPTIGISTPTSGSTYVTSASPVTLGGAAADNVAVTQVAWTNDRGGSGTATGTTSWTASGIGLQAGTNVLTITARDAAGNTATATLTVTYTAADTTAPGVTITTPTSGATYATNTTPVTVGGTAADNVGVTQVTWSNDRGGSGTASGTSNWVATGIGLQAGTNILTVTARDAAGNTGAKTLAISFDGTAPSVSLTAPSSGATLSGSTTLTATAADNVGVAGVQFLLDGAPLGAEQTGPYSLSWNTASATNGPHTLSARARDAAGNTALAPNISVTVSNTEQPTGLVAAYHFNEGSGSTVVDVSGNNNTGTVSGGTWTTAGRNGGALAFNGTSTRVTVADSASLGLTSAMTLEAWVYPTATPTGWRAVLAKNTDGYYLMASSDQGNRPVVGGTWVAGNQNLAGLAILPINTWTHLAATFDGSAVRLYVNGTLVASQPQTTALVPTTGTLQIGGDVYGEFFAGRIDDVRIYNRALSLAEIQTDMTIPVGGAPGPDTIPPTVATTSPTAGATYAANASPLTVAGTAADNVGVTQVTWTNDRGGSGTAAGTSSWTATGIALQPGTNVLVFTARDASANTGTKTLTVSFDATAPTIGISTPTSGSTYVTSASPVTLGGAAADNVAVTQVAWTNDRGGSGTATGTTSWTASGIGLQAGTNVLTITARDAAGNTATATLTVTYTAADTTAPGVTITTPTSGATYATNTTPVTVGGTAADNVGVTQVTWSNDRGGSGTASGTSNWVATGIGLQAGTNILTVTARDAAGNTGAKTLAISFDGTAPSVSLTAPSSGATLSGSTTLTATAADNVGVAGVQFLLDGAPLGAEQTGPYSLSWNTASATNGPHTLSARARDAAGNTALAPNISVTVSNTEQPTGLVAAYHFNEGSGSTVVDVSGNNNTGTVSGGTWTTAGRNGGALAFNGTSTRVTVADSASLGLTSAMTLEAWVYPTATPTGWRAVLAKNTDGYYLMASSDQGNRPVVGGTWVAGNQNLAGLAILPINTWTHLAATFDGSAVRLYVNGTLVASQPQTTALVPTTGTLQIGGDVYGEFFAGRIDDVRIYNRALSLAEIQTDMTTPVSGAPGPGPTPPIVAITAPAGGAAVSGTVTVTADASDNTGVASVQFFVNGNPIGPEDTTGPYSVQWNTAGVPAGQYILTARARDVDGNTTVSAPVTVTLESTNAAQVGSWSGPFDWDPLVAVHMVLTPTGKVLAWDGQEQAPSSARLWDPGTGEFLSVPNGPNLFCSGHCVIPDGRVFVAGGHASAYVGIRNLTLFQPTTETWASAASMAYPRWYPTTTVLPDGRVLVVSGSTDCATCIVEIPEIYNPATNTWQQLTGADLAIDLYPHMFVLPDGRVLASANSEGPMISQVLDINAQTWTPVGSSTALNGGSSVMYRPGVVMKSGLGWNVDHPSAPAVATTYVLDMNQPSPTWRQTASMVFPRTQHNLTLLPDGTVLATGGGGVSDVFNLEAAVLPAELWSPSTETWTTLASMQVPRLYHSTALLLPDGRVLSAGGGRFGVDQHSAEIFSPPYLFKGARPTITSAPTQITNGSSFTVETPDAAAISSVSLVRIGSVTHAINMDQRFLNLTFQAGAGALTVQAPVNANEAPPGYYMLFILNTSGVPSVAPIIRVR